MASRLEMNLRVMKDLISLKKGEGKDISSLKNYSGFGGLAEVLFDPYNTAFADHKFGSRSNRELIKEIYSTCKKLDLLYGLNKGAFLNSVKRSTNTAYYTPQELIRSMFEPLKEIGLSPLNILDPSAGVGAFANQAGGLWKGEITQVEKDLLTGEILRYSFPNTKVYVKPFEGYYPEKSFDLITTNIPFGNIGITDIDFVQGSEIERFSTQRIHNYFLIKGLNLLEEAGVMALVMPIGVMDSPSNKPIREALLKKGHILNLVRLPNNIFKASNTEVVSDIIIFQKDTNKTSLTAEDLMIIDQEGTFSHDGKEVKFNAYYEKYNDHLLGTPFIKGLYGNDFDLKATGEMTQVYDRARELIAQSTLKKPFGKAPQRIDFSANAKKRVQHVSNSLQLNLFDSIVLDSKQVKDEQAKSTMNIPIEMGEGDEPLFYKGALYEYMGTIGVLEKNKNGDFYLRPEQTDKNDYLLLLGFINLKNTYRRVIDGQTKELAEVEEIRQDFNIKYDDFIGKWGFINENEKLLSKFEGQINTYLAVEQKDIEGQYIKGDVFFKNTFTKSREQKEIEISQSGSLYDLLIYVLNEYGSPRLDVIARLSKIEEAECFEGLREFIFNTPDEGYQMRDAYLSGDIIAKIEQIERVVHEEIKLTGSSQFERNLEALKGVKPKALNFEDISISIGQRWIPISIYNLYLKEVFGNELKVIYRAASDTYLVQKQFEGKKQFGYTLSEIIEASMNSKMLKFYDTIEVEKGKTIRRLNPFYTKELQKLQEKYNQGFLEFLRNNPSYKKELTGLYNQKYNRLIKRNYDGQFLQLKDLNHYSPFPYQKDTVYMTTQNNGGYIDHCVGSGKTLTMIIASHELKRLKIANKPTILAVKSTLTDIASEYRKAYPSAKILVADDRNFEKAKREKFFSKIVNEDWDCIIMSHDNFGNIPQDRNLQMQVIQEEIDRLEADLEVYRGEKDLSKRMLRGLELRKEGLENDLKELGLKKDDTFTFQNMGIDHLFVDEADMFKNLRFTTRLENVRGLGNTAGAEKTKNLLIAIRSLQNKYSADKGVTFLSGTPISNSISEMYSILKYLTPGMLEKMDLISFDAWQKQFAQVTNDFEMTVTGEIKPTQRLSVFVNLPELLMLYSNIADVRVEKDIVKNIKNRPKAVHELVNIPPLERQLRFCAGVQLAVEYLDWSFLEIGIDRKFDEGEEKAKMLLATKLIDEMSLDMKLIDPNLFSDYVSPKLSTCVDKVLSHYLETDTDKGTQLIFCDKGTPKDDGSYSVYVKLKQMLTNSGIPANEIAFIHDAKSDKQRKELFSKVNLGEIRVLMGSTGKLGTGTNVQKKIVAMHHLDTLWRPRDMRQRIGRGERQGNEIGLKYGLKNYIYATEKTLDAYKFNMLDGKERFIEQIKKNEVGGRTASQDMLDDENTMSFSRIVAVLSGDNRLLRKTKLEREIDMLLYERKEINKSNETAKASFEEKQAILKKLNDDYKKVSVDYKLMDTIPRDAENKYAIFFHTMEGSVLKKATEIGEYLKDFVSGKKEKEGFEQGQLYNTMCSIGGFKVMACKIENLKGSDGLFSGSSSEIRFYLQGETSKLYSSDGRSFSSCEALQLGQFVRDALYKVETGYLRMRSDIEKLSKEKRELELRPTAVFVKDGALISLQNELDASISDLTINPVKNPLDGYKTEIMKSVGEKNNKPSMEDELGITDIDELIKKGKNISVN